MRRDRGDKVSPGMAAGEPQRVIAGFGSFLRDDFGDQSDIDMLIDTRTGVTWTLTHHLEMEEKMAQIVDRKVELVERTSAERSRNYIRRRHILATAEPIYEES
jgi:predicted nucleotidyltransferase